MRPARLAGAALFEARGVDRGEFEIAEPAVTLAAVARHARPVVDQRQPLADQAVEQRRLADVRPADDGDGEAHGATLAGASSPGTRRIGPRRPDCWGCSGAAPAGRAKPHQIAAAVRPRLGRCRCGGCRPEPAVAAGGSRRGLTRRRSLASAAGDAARGLGLLRRGGHRRRLRRRLIALHQFRRNALRHARHPFREHLAPLARQRLLAVPDACRDRTSRSPPAQGRSRAASIDKQECGAASSRSALAVRPASAISISTCPRVLDGVSDRPASCRTSGASRRHCWRARPRAPAGCARCGGTCRFCGGQRLDPAA